MTPDAFKVFSNTIEKFGPDQAWLTTIRTQSQCASSSVLNLMAGLIILSGVYKYTRGDIARELAVP